MINPTQLGTAVLVSTSLMSGLMMLIKVRDQLQEKPDPKTTYVTLTEFDKFRTHVFGFERDYKSDLALFRSETRKDLLELDHRQSGQIQELSSLIIKNSEHIASLTAQNSMLTQIIHELSSKTDRLIQRAYA